MSEQRDERAFAELDKCYTVFAGSSFEDASCAKVFWNSFHLHPQLESRLVSADVGQRLRAAGRTRRPHGVSAWNKNEEKFQQVQLKQQEEEKRRYLEMVKKRDDIMALLQKQREERIKKEMVSSPFKPKQCEKKERTASGNPPEEIHQDVKDVQDLK